jgi:hypothetical protein
MIFWLTTGAVSLFLLLSASSYFFYRPAIYGFRQLGFPEFFRYELAFLKIVAAIVLMIPGLPRPVVEWAYSGVALFLLTAIIAHHAHRDPIVLNVTNLGIFGVLALSYATRG